jgi:hypothetical protein
MYGLVMADRCFIFVNHSYINVLFADAADLLPIHYCVLTFFFFGDLIPLINMRVGVWVLCALSALVASVLGQEQVDDVFVLKKPDFSSFLMRNKFVLVEFCMCCQIVIALRPL